MDRTFSYAILKFVPDAYRGEQINIGVLVFGLERLDLRLCAQPTVMRALGYDPENFNWIPGALNEMDDAALSANERWSNLRRIPGLGLSDLGWFRCENDEQYESRISKVRSDYIDRPRITTRPRSAPGIVRQLRQTFKAHRVMGSKPEDLDKHKIVSNIPVGPSNKMHIDFLARNGVYHATETADFTKSKDTGVGELKETALAGYTLRYAREQLGLNSTKCYFVYLAPVIVESRIAPALEMIHAESDGVYNLSSHSDKRKYFDIILDALGSPQLFNDNI